MAEAEDRRGEEMDAGEKKAKQKGGFRAMPFILGDLFTLPDDAIISFFFFSFLREYYYFCLQFCRGWFMKLCKGFYRFLSFTNMLMCWKSDGLVKN